MIAMAVVVVLLLRLREAALQLRPSSINRVPTPEPVVPSDVHDSQLQRVPVGTAACVRAEEPPQESLGIGALLGIAHVDHPVDRTTFLVLAAPALIAIARNPGVLMRAVCRFDDLFQPERTGLG